MLAASKERISNISLLKIPTLYLKKKRCKSKTQILSNDFSGGYKKDSQQISAEFLFFLHGINVLQISTSEKACSSIFFRFQLWYPCYVHSFYSLYPGEWYDWPLIIAHRHCIKHCIPSNNQCWSFSYHRCSSVTPLVGLHGLVEAFSRSRTNTWWISRTKQQRNNQLDQRRGRGENNTRARTCPT